MKIVKDLTLIAILSAIIIVLELALSFLPNIQLTFFLIVLYSKVLGLKKTSLIVLIYVLIDNLIMGGISLYTLFVLVSLLVIPVSLNTIFKNVSSPIPLAILGMIFAFIYSWIYIIPTMLLTNINFVDYLMADIFFEILLASSTFLSILWLYTPVEKFLLNIIESKGM